MRVPYVWTGGNKNGIPDAQEYEIDYEKGNSLSWTGFTWDQLQENPKGKIYDQENLGYFTSRIPIMDPTGKTEVLSVYTLDTSGDYC